MRMIFRDGGRKTRGVRVDRLGLEDVAAVARDGAQVGLSPEARERVSAFREHIGRIEDSERAVYGITTGFGALAMTRIPPEERRELQHAILRNLMHDAMEETLDAYGKEIIPELETKSAV